MKDCQLSREINFSSQVTVVMVFITADEYHLLLIRFQLFLCLHLLFPLPKFIWSSLQDEM